MSTTQSALVWRAAGVYGVEQVRLDDPPPGWTAIDVAYAGICGSDLHICAGEHPRARPGAVLGHELVGRTRDATSERPAGSPVFANPMIACGTCDACRRGLDNVCLNLRAIGVDHPGALAPVVHVPSGNVHDLPADADLRRFALTEPLAVCVRAVDRGGVVAGSRVLVAGAGPIGITIALLAQQCGAEVVMSEPSTWRRDQAERLGLQVIDSTPEDGWADVVVDAAGHPAVAAASARWARPGGSIVVLAAYAPGSHPVDLLAVNFRELTIVGTRVYTDTDIRSAIEMLSSTDVFDGVISDVMPLSSVVSAIDALRRGEGLKILIDVNA
jgi:(R,R)-butanediol dehydrogenase / meso-butanediol dehydrogenase / diacetyl reductase